MRTRYLLAALIVAGLALVISRPSPADEAPRKEKIDKLIEQMGSGTFREREKATKELAAIGPPALEALRKAAKSDDAEVRRRAGDLLPKIEKQAESIRVLAPKRVHLVYKDTPLSEAVADFQKKSGYRIYLHDPDGKLKERKITLETGETTFWHAAALFCGKADLSEASMEDLIQERNAPNTPPYLVQPPGIFVPALDGQFLLKDGKTKHLPTDDRGAVRIRVLAKADLFDNVPKGEVILPLEVSLEPKLQWQDIAHDAGTIGRAVSLEPKLQWQGIGSIHIDKAVDDREQRLVEVIPQLERKARLLQAGVGGGEILHEIQMQKMQREKQNQMYLQYRDRLSMEWVGLNHLVPVQLKKGAKDAKTLKELKGVLTAQLLAEAQPVIVTDKLDKAIGKTFEGDEGSSVKIINVASEEKQTTIQLAFEPPPYDKMAPAQVKILRANNTGPYGASERGAIFRGYVQRMDSLDGLSIQDDKGNALPLDGLFSVLDARAMRQVNRVLQANGRPRRAVPYTLVCPHDKDTGKPARVVYHGRRRVTVEIPFALKDVPLP